METRPPQFGNADRALHTLLSIPRPWNRNEAVAAQDPGAGLSSIMLVRWLGHLGSS